MTIYLCRHGQTTGDIEDRYGGDYDDHLTNEGKEQARNLAEELSGKGVEKIFTSPKLRATETSEILANGLNCEIEVVPGLRERNQYGILTGMIKSEAKEKYPELPALFKDYKNTIKGAEDYDSFSERVSKALQEIAKNDYKYVAVITHGGPIKATLREIEYSFDYKIQDCAFAKLNIKGEKVTLEGSIGIVPVN